jgi:hypothetical protein
MSGKRQKRLLLASNTGWPKTEVGVTSIVGANAEPLKERTGYLGATVFRHLGIDLDAQWIDLQGRPQAIVTEGGRPIPELS